VLVALRRAVPWERTIADWVHVRATYGDSMFESEVVIKEPHKGCTSSMEAIVRVLHIKELGLTIEDADDMEGGVHHRGHVPIELTNSHLPLHH
jgi:hypothetical protein